MPSLLLCVLRKTQRMSRYGVQSLSLCTTQLCFVIHQLLPEHPTCNFSPFLLNSFSLIKRRHSTNNYCHGDHGDDHNKDSNTGGKFLEYQVLFYLTAITVIIKAVVIFKKLRQRWKYLT